MDTSRLLSPCEQGPVSVERGKLKPSPSAPKPPTAQVWAPSGPTSKLLLFSLLITATSSPVPVGVISKLHAGNM